LGRKSSLRSMMRISVFLLVVLLVLYFLIHSPFFDIQAVSITGNQVVMAGEIKALSGIVTGANMFEVDCKQAARAVEVHPLIKRASISRQLPGRVTIKVVEREPWGIVPVDSDFLVIDDCGVCLDRASSIENWSGPVITLENVPASTAPGTKVAPQAAAAVKNILAQLSPDTINHISAFHCASNGQVYIYTLKGTEIRFGNQDMLQDKIRWVNEVMHMEEHLEVGRALEYVDLRFKGQPVVKYRVAR
jgi:cell division protein FtsQ